MVRKCSHPGCERDHLASGFCRMHYQRNRNYGTPLGKKHNPEARFWEKVQKGPDCWLWTGSSQRYGVISVEKLRIGAHRYSYELHKGPVPDGLFVMHSCDNPKCVNPDHLSVGTAQDNMDDMRAKGRRISVYPKGEDSRWALLNEEAVRFIRTSDLSNVELGKRYGVVPNTIRAIRIRKSWKHVT